MNYSRLQRALAARIRKKAEGQRGGSSSASGTSGDGGTGGSGGSGGDGGGGDGGGDGGGGRDPVERQFVFQLSEGGVTYALRNDNATQREVVECQFSGVWYRYRRVLGSFDVSVWMHSTSVGALYFFANSLGSDEGGGVGYYDWTRMSIDGGDFVDLQADQGGGDKHILLVGQCDTGVVEDYSIRRDINQPDTRSWLDGIAESELNSFVEAVGPFDCWPNDDKPGAAPGRQGVGYYYEWLRASSKALRYALRRAEAGSRRHRIFRSKASNGKPRFDNVPYSQIREGVELRWSGSAWVQNALHIPPEYQGRFPTGQCPYETDRGEWNSFDGQHQRRFVVYWEVLEHHDPRAQFMFKFAVNDAIMAYNPNKIPGEGTGTDAYGGTFTDFMSVPTFEEFCATDPVEFGAPGDGIFKRGREFAHAVGVVARWGTEEEKQPFRDFINKYFRKDPLVTDPDGLGFLWRKRPGVHGGGNEGRDVWTKSLGAEATPANPSYTKTRETQFLIMNLAKLGGCQECIDAYMTHLEPWPLQEFQSANSSVGSSDVHIRDSYPAYSPSGCFSGGSAYGACAGNDSGHKLAADYSLAFGNFHDETGPKSGPYTSPGVLYAVGILNNSSHGLDENILHNCPTSMWSSAV